MAVTIDSGLNALKNKNVKFKVSTLADAATVSSLSANLGTIVFAKSTNSSGENVADNPAAIYVNGVKVAETNPTSTALDDAYKVSVRKTTSGLAEGIAASYTIAQGGITLSTINVLKDNVISDGEITTPALEYAADSSNTSISYGGNVYTYNGADKDTKFLKLNVNNGGHFYILVSDLVDVYTVADTAEIDMSMSNTNEISASIKTGSIAKSKLASAVQTSLGKADSSILSVSLASGTNNGTVKLTVNGTATDNIAVKGLQSGAYATVGDNVNNIPFWGAKYGSSEALLQTVPFTWPVSLTVIDVGGTPVGSLTTHAPSKLEQSATNGKVKYTNEVGTVYDVAVKGLGSAAYLNAGNNTAGLLANWSPTGTLTNNDLVVRNNDGLSTVAASSITAGKATADGSGNNIVNTYSTKANTVSAVDGVDSTNDEKTTAPTNTNGYFKVTKNGSTKYVKPHGLDTAAYYPVYDSLVPATVSTMIPLIADNTNGWSKDTSGSPTYVHVDSNGKLVASLIGGAQATVSNITGVIVKQSGSSLTAYADANDMKTFVGLVWE